LPVHLRTIYPLVTTILSFVYAFYVGQQYLARRRPHQLVWTIGLILFGLSAFPEFYSELWPWNPLLYRLYYVGSASLVAFLGAGTVYLLYNKKIGHVFLAYTVLVTLYMLVRALGAPVDVTKFEPGIVVAGRAMDAGVRRLSPLLSGPGTLALFGGAVYSWIKAGTAWNLLIAAGTALIAVAGFGARQGFSEHFYLAELIGLFLMFLGFMYSREVIRARDAARGAAGRGAGPASGEGVR
jgi:hypothetical protein